MSARGAKLVVGTQTFNVKVRATSRIRRGKAGTVTLLLSARARKALAATSAKARATVEVRVTSAGRTSKAIIKMRVLGVQSPARR